MTPSEIETATFWLVAQCLNQVRYRVPLTVRSNGHNFTVRMEIQYNACAPVLTSSVSKYKLLFYYMTINQGKNHTLIISIFTYFSRIKLMFSLKDFKVLYRI